jgi:hypothetical protein
MGSFLIVPRLYQTSSNEESLVEVSEQTNLNLKAQFPIAWTRVQDLDEGDFGSLRYIECAIDIRGKTSVGDSSCVPSLT